ncbi:MAG: hypothetical protein ACREQY_10820 [Candidatus Binatia bacterium]
MTAYTNVLFHQVLDGCASPAPEGCDPTLDPDGIVRDPDPARVVCKVYPFHFVPEYGLVHTGAYWVSGLAVREASTDSSYGMIDAKSRALAWKLRGGQQRIGPEVRFYAPTTDPYHFQGLRRTPSGDDPESSIEVGLVNLRRATLDLERMSIDDTGFQAVVSGDGPAELTLLGGFSTSSPVTILRDGEPFSEFVLAEGRLTLQTTFGEPSTFEVAR